jgi:hypothetical protein
MKNDGSIYLKSLAGETPALPVNIALVLKSRLEPWGLWGFEFIMPVFTGIAVAMAGRRMRA